MWILDRYLLRQFVRAFLICFLSLAGLYIVLDAFSHLDEFISQAQKSQTPLVSLMGAYYGAQTIMVFDRISGLMALFAAMFTVSWIQRHNELIAIQSAGVSRLRVMAPVIGAAVVISICSAADRELVIPRFSRELSQKPRELSSGQELAPCYDYRTYVFIQGKAAFADQQRISQPEFHLPHTPHALDRYGKELAAEDAYYKPPEEGRPGGYLLDKVKSPKGLADRPSIAIDGQPVIVTPRDAPGWLAPDQCFVASDLTFDQLIAGKDGLKLSSTPDLIRRLRNDALGLGGGVRVEVHARMVRPLLDVTLLFLGLPLVLTRQSPKVFISMGLCLLVVSVFSMVVLSCHYLGENYALGFTPALGAWLPLIIFVPVAAGMADLMWR